MSHVTKTWYRKVKKLAFWEGSKTPGVPFDNVVVVAKADHSLKRLMMDVYDETRASKLASFFGRSNTRINPRPRIALESLTNNRL